MVRASGLHPEGRKFEPCTAHHIRHPEPIETGDEPPAGNKRALATWDGLRFLFRVPADHTCLLQTPRLSPTVMTGKLARVLGSGIEVVKLGGRFPPFPEVCHSAAVD